MSGTAAVTAVGMATAVSVAAVAVAAVAVAGRRLYTRLMTHPDSPEAYVRAALKLQGYEFDEHRIREIVAQFARIEAIARTVLAVPIAERAGAAAMFRP
jgi:hypothetical protein